MECNNLSEQRRSDLSLKMEFDTLKVGEFLGLIGSLRDLILRLSLFYFYDKLYNELEFDDHKKYFDIDDDKDSEPDKCKRKRHKIWEVIASLNRSYRTFLVYEKGLFGPQDKEIWRNEGQPLFSDYNEKLFQEWLHSSLGDIDLEILEIKEGSIEIAVSMWAVASLLNYRVDYSLIKDITNYIGFQMRQILQNLRPSNSREGLPVDIRKLIGDRRLKKLTLKIDKDIIDLKVILHREEKA